RRELGRGRQHAVRSGHARHGDDRHDSGLPLTLVPEATRVRCATAYFSFALRLRTSALPASPASAIRTKGRSLSTESPKRAARAGYLPGRSPGSRGPGRSGRGWMSLLVEGKAMPNKRGYSRSTRRGRTRRRLVLGAMWIALVPLTAWAGAARSV